MYYRDTYILFSGVPTMTCYSLTAEVASELVPAYAANVKSC